MGEAETNIKLRAEERIGTVLREKWCLDRLLGLGGMAAVYSATHRNGKRAAIKMLHPEAALIPDIKARFLREGYLANKVGHFGAVSILDDDIDENGNVYLVMELLEGETLEERWRREDRLPWAEMLVVAEQVLDVLIAAHHKQIVHRDLKPGNVFVHADGTVKILDFGIARLGRLQPGTDDTGPHVSLGTPGFMPPEQARGRSADVDAQSDLWALGATMFALLTGRHVHEAETANEQLLKAMTEPALPLSDVIPEIPEQVAQIVDRALRYEKSERWADAAEMQAAVRECYEQLMGESIGRALRLSVPILRVSRSVRPDAPTLAADLPPQDERLTTTRPVSDKTADLVEPAPQRSRKWAVVGALALLMAVIAGFVISQSETQTPVAAAGAPAAVPTQAATELDSKQELPSATAAEVAPIVSENPPSTPKPRATARRAGVQRPAPAKSAAPAPDVDIFTRRK